MVTQNSSVCAEGDFGYILATTYILEKRDGFQRAGGDRFYDFEGSYLIRQRNLFQIVQAQCGEDGESVFIGSESCRRNVIIAEIRDCRVCCCGCGCGCGCGGTYLSAPR